MQSASTLQEEIEITVTVEGDVVRARGAGRDMCRAMGFSEINQVKVATAISELARNIFHYAKAGKVTLKRLTTPRLGIEIIASDNGPGIPDVKHVLSGNYKSKTGMGKGLLGSRRLMDHFECESAPGRTVIVLRKYSK